MSRVAAGEAIFHRQPRSVLPVAARGDGIYVVDTEGRCYLDACSGAAVSCLGHNHPAVIAAMHEQIDRIAYAHTGFFTSEPAEQLASEVTEQAPGDLDHVYLVSGGSEAMEAALKMVRQFHLERGEPDRQHIIARRQSFHGNTLGALSVGGNHLRREPFAPILLPSVSHVSPCFAYRGMAAGETEDAYGRRLVAELEQTVQDLGPGNVAAFVAETVVGATAGAVPPVPGYFQGIRALCDRHGILLVLDEVMCGMGRTGTLFACEQEGVVPDLVTVAKGLGAGYQAIGAVIVREHVYRAFVDGSGFFQHGHTYMGHPVACAAALAVQRTIRDENLLENVVRQGEFLMDALQERFGNHHHVGDIRGRGLFAGIELVADRATKEPFDPARRLHARIRTGAMENGLMCYPMGGTADGVRGDHILLAPPFIIREEQVTEIVDILGRTVDDAIGEAA